MERVFCDIPFPDMNNLLPVLITNNHVLNNKSLESGNEIEFTTNDDKFYHKIIIDENRKVYTNNEPFDVPIIEIKKSDCNMLLNFLEIDENMFNIDDYKIYNQKSVYLVHYPNGKKWNIHLVQTNIFHQIIIILSIYAQVKEGLLVVL